MIAGSLQGNRPVPSLKTLLISRRGKDNHTLRKTGGNYTPNDIMPQSQTGSGFNSECTVCYFHCLLISLKIDNFTALRPKKNCCVQVTLPTQFFWPYPNFFWPFPIYFLGLRFFRKSGNGFSHILKHCEEQR